MAKRRESMEMATRIASRKPPEKLIKEKAYDLYQKRGCKNGFDQEDWFNAERILTKQLKDTGSI